MALIGSSFDDGEVYVQSLLARLVEPEIWKIVVRAEVPCSLVYSDDELSRQKKELAKWAKDIERKACVIEEVGAYTGWDGVVTAEEYSIVSERLEKARVRFLDAEAKSHRERAVGHRLAI
jgi:hypothetical protein